MINKDNIEKENIDNLAESQAINARAKAVSGDFAGALSEADKAVAADNKNIYTYLNRADIYHMLGELDKALADIAQAKEIDKKNAVSYYLAAVIEDEQGNTIWQLDVADYENKCHVIKVEDNSSIQS